MAKDKLAIQLPGEQVFFAIGEVAKLFTKIIETTPPEQHAKNWARWDRFASWVEKLFGIPLPQTGTQDEPEPPAEG